MQSRWIVAAIATVVTLQAQAQTAPVQAVAQAAAVAASSATQVGAVDAAQAVQSVQPVVQKVRNAQMLGDGSRVVLEGHIISRASTFSSKEYLFQDDTGTIKVEIDDKYWRGMTITPQTRVRLWGEIDYGILTGSREVDVDRVEIVK